jgi:beta-glucosidase
MDKPSMELKAFAKTRLLSPGESQTLSFDIKSGDLASYDVQQEAWVAEGGTYLVNIGASSKDIRQTGKFTLAKDLVVEKDDKVLAPPISISELHSKSN